LLHDIPGLNQRLNHEPRTLIEGTSREDGYTARRYIDKIAQAPARIHGGKSTVLLLPEACAQTTRVMRLNLVFSLSQDTLSAVDHGQASPIYYRVP
jgi:hypothetical protein